MFESTGLLDDVILPVTGKGRTHVFNYYVIPRRSAHRAARRPGRRRASTPASTTRCRCTCSAASARSAIRRAISRRERAAKEVLALPLFPGLTTDQQEFVVASIAEFYKPAKKVLDTKRAPRGAI